MRRLAAILALVLGLTLLAAPPASAAVAASAENRVSGSAAAPHNLIGIETRLSERSVRENIALVYDLASDDAVAARAVKAVNLPAWKKVGIDMGHVLERHTAQVALAAGRTTFPELMNAKGIERAVREAYRYGEKIGSQGDRVLMQGTSGGMTIEMWVNRATGMIETAYPVVR